MKQSFKILIDELFLVSEKKRNNAIFWALIFSLFYLIFSCIGIITDGYEQQYQNFKGFLLAVTSFIIVAIINILVETCRGALFFLLKTRNIPRMVLLFTISVAMAAIHMLVNIIVDAQSLTAINILSLFISSFLISHLVENGGVIPGVIYSVTTKATMILPFYVHTTNFSSLALGIILPVMFLIALKCDNKNEEKTKEKKKGGLTFNIAIITLVAFTVLFSLGILPINPISIATGSMEPVLNIGDMALVNTYDKDEIEIGDIIKFNKNGIHIIHRVDDIQELNGECVYITKGDANNSQDVGYVTKENIEGTVVGKIPKLGYFTLWLHSVESAE